MVLFWEQHVECFFYFIGHKGPYQGSSQEVRSHHMATPFKTFPNSLRHWDKKPSCLRDNEGCESMMDGTNVWEESCHSLEKDFPAYLVFMLSLLFRKNHVFVGFSWSPLKIELGSTHCYFSLCPWSAVRQQSKNIADSDNGVLSWGAMQWSRVQSRRGTQRLWADTIMASTRKLLQYSYFKWCHRTFTLNVIKKNQKAPLRSILGRSLELPGGSTYERTVLCSYYI